MSSNPISGIQTTRLTGPSATGDTPPDDGGIRGGSEQRAPFPSPRMVRKIKSPTLSRLQSPDSTPSSLPSKPLTERKVAPQIQLRLHLRPLPPHTRAPSSSLQQPPPLTQSELQHQVPANPSNHPDSPTHMVLKQDGREATAQQVISLIKKGDNQGVSDILSQVTDYEEAKHLTQIIHSGGEGKNKASIHMGKQRMVELKHQDLISQAKESGCKTPDKIKIFAEETLATHRIYHKHSETILQNLDRQLKTHPSLKHRSVPQIPDQAGTGGPPIPKRRRLSPTPNPSEQNITSDLTPKVPRRAGAAAPSQTRATQGTSFSASPAEGNSRTVSPELRNHERYEALKKHTKNNPVATMPTTHARYNDVQSPEKTNVPIKTIDPATGHMRWSKGKINANRVPLGNQNGAIATQYPLSRIKNTATVTVSAADIEASRASFWKMNLQQETLEVFDLTQPGETDTAPYYPTRLGETKQYEDMSVTLLKEDGNRTTYQVTDQTTGKHGKISRYHHKNWVDKTAPDTEELFKLATLVADNGNTSIHCKAGIGRTMTVYAAAALLILMRENPISPDQIDDTVDRIIKGMRKTRGKLAIQTASQRLSLVKMAESWIKK